VVLCLFVWCCARGLFAPDLAELLSRRFVYKVGRRIDGTNGDAGMFPSSAFRALELVGAPLESLYAYDGSNDDRAYLDEVPPQSVFQAASDLSRSIQAHRIVETGPARGLLVRQALAARLPVLVGLAIDQAVEDAGPGDIIDAPRGPTIGGHALAVLGYRTNADGTVDYLVRNWWGEGWGDGGDAWVTAGFLDACADVWVIDSSAKVTS
jgi:hypothetical protein